MQVRAGSIKDIDQIAEMNRQMWFGGSDSDEELSTWAAMNDTLYMAQGATYLQVAEHDGAIVGFLMGRADGAQPLFDTARISQRLKESEDLLNASDEGRKLLNYMNLDRADTSAMEQESTQGAQAEVILFIVGPAARGHHLGGRLFTAFLEYLESKDIEKYYLYTDTTCTYGFYEHRGMYRVAEHMEAPTPEGGVFDKFIYMGSLNETLAMNTMPDHVKNRKTSHSDQRETAAMYSQEQADEKA